MSLLSRPYFHDEAEAFRYLESILWPNGPICPHCGAVGRVYDLKGVRGSKSKKNPEGAIRHGLKKCGECRQQFTVKVGTVFEHGRIPLHKMLQAVFLMTSSKKGISAHQLHRVLEIQYRSAWFLAHRIREAMRAGDLAPFGGGGGIVEADETFIGKEPFMHNYSLPRSGYFHKMKVLALVDRDTRHSRSMVVDFVDSSTITPILQENISREARIMTDEAAYYRRLRKHFAAHGTVQHKVGEYGRGEIHTNTVEGYFSIFKRGMKGVYQHCAKKHLHRYLAEFDFRYCYRIANGLDDWTRSDQALRGIVGKRLTYGSTDR